MDVLKTATEWTKAEVNAYLFFVLFGVLFIVATIGFWQFGKTDFAKAFVISSLVAGALFLVLGFGLYFSNKPKLIGLEAAYHQDASEFINAQKARAEQIMGEYENIVFKVIPIIIIVAALLLIFLNSPLWRAISITTIAFMVIVILVDSHAHARFETYHKQLVSFTNQ